MTRAWTVRGGQFREREEQALGDGLVIAGWEELGDLSSCESVSDVGILLARDYPDTTSGTVDNWKHQLWRFITMKTGDLVVMPRKYLAVVGVGRLTGDYEYRKNAEPGFRHVRRVEWIRTNVDRAAIGGDLRDSMGAFLTIRELSRRNAAARVQNLAETGNDPGYDGGIEPPADLEGLEHDVQQDGTRQLTARDLIGLWGWQRRTGDLIDFVDQELAQRGLHVEPHFTEVQLDGLVTVSPLDPPDRDAASDDLPPTDEEDSTTRTAQDRSGEADLSWRIGSLPFVTQVVTVRIEDALSRAITRMVEGDFSQLPVVNHHNVLRGVITWESIARAQLGGRAGTVKGALDPHPRTARKQEELFVRLGDVQHRGFLIVVDEENVVNGILTATDLSGQLKLRVEPCTLLEEVERRLRRLTSRLADQELPDKARTKRARGENFTLGQYKFIVEKDNCWAKLGWPYEQDDMADRLKTVADYRNRMAHWDVDAPEQDAGALTAKRQLLKLLKIIDRDPTP